MSKQDFTLKKINSILNSTPSTMVSMNVSKTDKDQSKIRKIGDKWEDEDGHIWEQKDGFKVRVSKNHDVFQSIRDELYIPKICPKCKNPMKKWQDKKFYRLNKTCMKCHIQFEHELRLNGTYDAYAKNRVKQNALAWLRDAEKEVVILKNSLKNEYVNEDGTIETWSSEVSPEDMKIQIDTQFLEFKKEFLKRL